MKAFSLFFLLFLSFPPVTNAQITRGNWLVGGNAGFSSSHKTYGFVLQPKIAYFPMDKFAAGLSLRLNHSKVSGNRNSIWQYGLGPFLRYYFLPTDKPVNVFGEAGYFFVGDLRSGLGPESSTYNFDLKTGAVLFLTGSVGLEVTLNYGYFKSSGASESSITNQFSLGIGFQVHLKKK